MEAAFGARLLRGMGSLYHFNPLAQELTGHFWVPGRFLGRQYLGAIPDERNAEVLVALVWNGWMSHQLPEARRVLSRFSKDPGKLLVAIDPRRSETAKRANLHLALRPGGDALPLKAMIAIILAEGWADADANSNTQMRGPKWNLRYRACTVAMHPDDVASLGLADGDIVRVTTGSGPVEGELEIDDGVRVGTVIIPHGFGLTYKGETYGFNVNRLTSSRHKDPFAGTPLHRYIPCRVESAGAAMSA